MLRGKARGDWLATPRAAELRDHLRRRQWSETSAAGIESLVTMDELREVLEPDTALLSFVWSEGRMVCLVVTTDIAQVIEIPAWRAAHAVLGGLRSDLDMSASVRSGPLAAVVRQSLDDRLRTLSDALLAAPVAVAGADRFAHHRARRAERNPLGDAAGTARPSVHDRRLRDALGGDSRGITGRSAGICRIRHRPRGGSRT